MDDYDEIKGLFFGILVGGLCGLGLLWWIEEPFFFTGDIIVLGVIVGAVLGYLWGYEVISFISHFCGLGDLNSQGQLHAI